MIADDVHRPPLARTEPCRCCGAPPEQRHQPGCRFDWPEPATARPVPRPVQDPPDPAVRRAEMAERRVRVTELAAAGLRPSEIAATVGVTRDVIRNDLRRLRAVRCRDCQTVYDEDRPLHTPDCPRAIALGPLWT